MLTKRTELVVVLVVCLIPMIGHAQSRVSNLEKYSEIEAISIRRAANLSATPPIKLIESKNIPSDDPLKVYVASILDVKLRKEFTKWMERWNRKDASRYGQLAIVEKPTDADILVVWYVLHLSGNEVVAAINRGEIRPPNLQPVYSYLLTRTPTEMTIVWRDFVFSNPDQKMELAETMERALEGRMKKRAKALQK